MVHNRISVKKISGVNTQMEDIKVKLTDGEVTLKKPKASAFFKAMEEAEISNGELKMTKLFNLLLPACIGMHPWGMKPLKNALGDLSVEDYVKLFNQVKNLINLKESDMGK
jgi:hypothetical protein